MAPRLQQGVLNELKELFDAGWSTRRIHRERHLSRACIAKIRLNLDLFNDFYPPPGVKIGRPRTLSAFHEQVRGVGGVGGVGG